ncbi:hypothetical protein IAS59_004226 [Cryptococcus gattii]
MKRVIGAGGRRVEGGVVQDSSSSLKDAPSNKTHSGYPLAWHDMNAIDLLISRYPVCLSRKSLKSGMCACGKQFIAHANNAYEEGETGVSFDVDEIALTAVSGHLFASCRRISGRFGDHSGGRHHGPCTSKRTADGRISWRDADDKLWKTGMGIFALLTSAISYRHQRRFLVLFLSSGLTMAPESTDAAEQMAEIPKVIQNTQIFRFF